MKLSINNISEPIKECLEFEGDKLYHITPLPQYGNDVAKKELVMTKEIFVKCYDEWIKEQTMTCKWVVRPGKHNTFWAYTSCKPGFNYLSRISRAEDIKAAYDGKLCPICGGIIRCNTELVEEQNNDDRKMP